MTYGPEARHFDARLSTLSTQIPLRESVEEYQAAGEVGELTPETPKSRWRTAWTMARGHWPR